jgi:hypothetical protein
VPGSNLGWVRAIVLPNSYLLTIPYHEQITFFRELMNLLKLGIISVGMFWKCTILLLPINDMLGPQCLYLSYSLFKGHPDHIFFS